MNITRWLKKSRSGSSLGHLALPVELEDGKDVRRNRKILRGCFVMICLAVAWSALTPVRELALAPGEVAALGQLRSIQHLEGGVVAEIAVSDGTAVKANQMILRLTPSIAGSDLAALQVRQSSLTQQQAQISALLSGKAPELLKNTPLSVEQRNVYETRGMMRAAERQAWLSRIDQRREAIQGLINESASLNRLTAINKEQLEMRTKLEAKGLTSRRALLESMAVYEQNRQQLASLNSRLEAARQALSEAESELERVKADASRLLSEELARINADLAEVNENISKLTDRVDRLAVRAPVDGTILQLVPRSVGEVVRSGDTIARFVPSNEPLVAEVRIRPADIGHVKVGDHAEIKVSTFDQRVFGKLKGTVKFISPSSLPRDNGEPYFRSQIVLDEHVMHGMGRAVTLIPGMMVDAEIITGAKSLLSYLLRPFQNTLSASFSER